MHDWVLWILLTASALHVVEEHALGRQGWATEALGRRIGVMPTRMDVGVGAAGAAGAADHGGEAVCRTHIGHAVTPGRWLADPWIGRGGVDRQRGGGPDDG